MLRQQQTTPIKTNKSIVRSERVAEYLEKSGWKKEIAGNDFDKAVKAICMMFETGRGLLLTGSAGCGKTSLARCIRRMLGLDGYSLYYCGSEEDLKELRSNTLELCNGSIVIDDIGVEETKKNFGNVEDTVGVFIQTYHLRGKGRFIGTTNMNAKDLGVKYGSRIVDRLLEMCVVMRFDGASKRERIII